MKVRSGVPQGTVLGPLLFLLYVNDIAQEVGATVRLFADDREVNTVEDAQALQADLDIMVEWARKWMMQFNPQKCYILRVTKKKKQVAYDYQMQGHSLEVVKHQAYLGVHIDETLSWDHHIKQAVSKATRTLNLIRRKFSACSKEVKLASYKSLVRPHLEYAQCAWDPYKKTQIEALEMVQRRAVRFISGITERQASVTN